MKNVFLYILFCLCFSSSYSQYTVSIINMKYSNGTSIPSGQPINFGSNSTVSFTFEAKVTTNLNLTGSNVFGNFEVYAKRVNHSSPDWLQTVATTLTPTFSTPAFYTETSVGTIALNASDFNSSGDYIYVVYKPNAGGSFNSGNWPLTKNGASGAIGNYDICCDQTISLGSNAATIIGQNPTGGSGSYTYSWLYSTTTLFNMNPVPGATSKDYSPGNISQSTFYQRITKSPGATNVSSSVVLVTVNMCPESNQISSTVTEANSPSNLQASSNLRLINRIELNATATYHAGDYVVLANGFHGLSGSAVHAYVADCIAGRPANLENDDSTEIVLSKQADESQSFLYPNPATEKVTISSDKIMVTITINDLTGTLLFQRNIKDTLYEIDVNNFKNGIYIVNVITEDGRIRTEKLFKN